MPNLNEEASATEPLLDSQSEQPPSSIKACWTETQRVVLLGGPVCFQSALAYSSNLVSLSFAGHLGQLQMSQAVLALSAYNVTGFSLLLGMATGMETLCGQAYGARNYQMLGKILQRALLICTLLFAVVLLFWTQLEYLLILAGQDEDIAGGAVFFMWRLAPALYCFTLNECLKRYLMAQNVVQPSTLAMGVAALLCPFYNWLLVIHLKMGLAGAAHASSAVQATSLLLLSSYVIWRDWRRKDSPKCTWHGWSGDCFRQWPRYFALAVPCLAACCLEWWLYEGLILIAGLLPNAQVAVSAMGVGFNTTALTYCISLGVAGAASTRVANELGAGSAAGAKRAAHVVFWLEMLLMCCVFGFGMSVRRLWAQFFTSDEEVLDTVVLLLPVILFSEFGDGANGVCGGIMRGAGRQLLASVLNAFSYWVVGLPLAILFSLKLGWGVDGLWWGLAATTSLQGIAMYVCVCCFNWEAEAKRALQSASEGTAPPIPLDATDASKLMPPLLSRPSYTRVTPPDGFLQGEQECLLPVVAEADA